MVRVYQLIIYQLVMAQMAANLWQEEYAKVTSAMAIAGLKLMGHGSIGPMKKSVQGVDEANI